VTTLLARGGEVAASWTDHLLYPTTIWDLALYWAFGAFVVYATITIMGMLGEGALTLVRRLPPFDTNHLTPAEQEQLRRDVREQTGRMQPLDTELDTSVEDYR
jgi:hypothetical protein